MGLFKEFKKFAMRGNVFDMAVGVVIGAAFSGIVNSLVADIILPLVGSFTGGLSSVASLFIALDGGKYPSLEAVPETVSVLRYGNLIQVILNFLIVAFCLFLIIRTFNKLPFLNKAEAPPPPKRKCPYCLSEIADEATRCPHCTSTLVKGDESPCA